VTEGNPMGPRLSTSSTLRSRTPSPGRSCIRRKVVWGKSEVPHGEDIRALHAPHAHTDGDSLVYFTKSNVVHMGDNFVRYGFPYIDTNAGGSVTGMIEALEQALAHLPSDVKSSQVTEHWRLWRT
jgi:glyoxylase-like metal-dependent hydrolase (beta-lactamase superfamily II)